MGQDNPVRPKPLNRLEELVDFLITQVVNGNNQAGQMLSAFQSGVHPLQVIDDNGDIFSMVVTVDINENITVTYFNADGTEGTPQAPVSYYYPTVTVNGNVGGYDTSALTVLSTSNGVAYSDGDNIGGGITFGLRKTSGASCVVKEVSFWSKENQKPNLYVFLFKEDPSNGTYSNNVAQVVAGDELNFAGFFEVASADWKDCGAISVCTKNIEVFFPSGAPNNKIYLAIMTKTAITYTSTQGLAVKVSAKQN